MIQIPADVIGRRDTYLVLKGRESGELRGYGVDGFVWETDVDSIIKVFRRHPAFDRELAVYRRLAKKSLYQLQGFSIPILIDFLKDALVLEISNVAPPYILDFGAATLDRPPADFDPECEAWNAEQTRKFGRDWPAVRRLLDALRHYGIHYPDVHTQNIRVRP